MDQNSYEKIRQNNIKKQIAYRACESLGGNINAKNVGRFTQAYKEILIAFNKQQKPFERLDRIISTIKK